MGFNWFWDRVSDEWITSTQASNLFALAALLICLLTAYLLSGIQIPNPSIVQNTAAAIFGVCSVLSIPFLWGGMRRYQDIRDKRYTPNSKAIRAAMLVGFCYTAIIYFAVVYLPTRTQTRQLVVGE